MTSTKIITGTFIIVFIIFLGSCSGWTLGEVGPIQSVFRPVSDCQTLEISQKFDVILQNDTALPEGYTIEYHEKLIPQIEHDIAAGVLTISDANRAKWTQDLSMSPKVTVNLHHYEQLNIEGSSIWKCVDTLQSNRLFINMKSSQDQDIWISCNDLMGKCENIGSIKLTGKGTIFSFTIESGGQLIAKDLNCHDAYIWHFTQRDCWVNPERQAFIKLYNSGNLYMKERAFYKKEIIETGKGRVIFEP